MDTISDIEQKQRADRAAVREDAELFTALLSAVAWKRYVALVEVIGQNYYAAAMKPLESTLEVTKTEYAKGILTGLSLATAIPNLKIREAQELRREVDVEE
jgi:hypothetical protein